MAGSWAHRSLAQDKSLLALVLLLLYSRSSSCYQEQATAGQRFEHLLSDFLSWQPQLKLFLATDQRLCSSWDL